MISFVFNILWFILGGLIACIGYVVAGIAMCVTIIGIPFGFQSFKLAIAILWPFGRRVVPLENADSTLRIIFNLLWLFLVGWELALNHVFWACVCGITIVGIPFAVQHLKLARLALWPFGYDFRSADDLVPAPSMQHSTQA
jgi:uncharacterized membrane protein YccF (DUF307 family)